jgi:hypothetical protein
MQQAHSPHNLRFPVEKYTKNLLVADRIIL